MLEVPLDRSPSQMSPTAPRWYALPAYFRSLAGKCPQAILLETLRLDSANNRSYLFIEPTRVLQAWSPAEIPDVFRQIDAALAAGCHVAGFLAYEAGYHFLDMQSGEAASSEPLAWFGVYPAPCIFDHGSGVVEGAAALPGGRRVSRTRFGG